MTNAKKRLTPRPDQRNAIRAGVRELRRADAGTFVMPCGSGKTLVSIRIAEGLDSRRVVVVVPTLHLQEQMLTSWLREIESIGTRESQLLVIGSDRSLAKRFDAVVTTSSPEIVSTLQKAKSKPVYIFCTYQSSPQLGSALADHKIKLDLAIFDEAHRTAGEEKVAFQALMESDVVIQKRLFMTATPRVISVGLVEPEGRVFSMRDSAIYGNIFFELSIKEAVEKDIISPYKIVTMMCQSSIMERALTERADTHSTSIGKGTTTRLRNFAVAVEIVKAIQRLNLRHIIAFTSRRKESEALVRTLQFVSRKMEVDIDAFHVDGTMTPRMRKRAFDGFQESKVSILCNARLLVEGYDMPAVDAVVFVDDKSSVTDIVQAAGRAWRKSPGKSFGYIILPLFLNTNGDWVPKHFEAIRRVLVALGSSDVDLYNYFRTFIHSGRRDGLPKPLTFSGESPRLFNANGFFAELGIKVWRRLRVLERSESGGWATAAQAAQFTRGLSKYGITNSADYRNYCSRPSLFPGAPVRPANIPVDLAGIYGDQYRLEEFFSNPRRASAYRPSTEAAEFCRSLAIHGITNPSQFRAYCLGAPEFAKAPARPLDIPTKPWVVYPDYQVSDFFVKPGSPKGIAWMEIDQCISFVNSLAKFGIRRPKDWKTYCLNPKAFPGAPSKPANVPTLLHRAYGDKYVARVFFPDAMLSKATTSIDDAKVFTRSLGKYGIRSHGDWQRYCDDPTQFPGAPKLPPGIPKSLRTAYRGRYSQEDFFDTVKTPTLAEASTFTKSLAQFGVTSFLKWKEYFGNPSKFPGAPEVPKDFPKNLPLAFKGRYSPSLFFAKKPAPNVKEVIDFTKGLAKYGITSHKRWLDYRRGVGAFKAAPKWPDHFPNDLRKAYPAEFKERRFFPGTSRSGDYVGWQEARTFTMSLARYGVHSLADWNRYYDDPTNFKGAPKVPPRIPKALRTVYGENFTSADFFEAAHVPTLDEVLTFVKSLRKFGIESYEDWLTYRKHPGRYKGAPVCPKKIRINLYRMFPDAKITFFPRTQYVGWQDASKFTRSLGKYGIHKLKDWTKYFDDPSSFPGAPTVPEGIPKWLYMVYKKDFSMDVFFSRDNSKVKKKVKAKKKRT